jgi:ArsR family metal-binding transcriptional regulator
MLLNGYRKEIFRPKCNPGFESVHCIAHLDQDIGEALPYLNAELGGFEYFRDPPAVTFRVQGKIITVHPREIAVNALKDGAEADKILQWLQREINGIWERREQIQPSYQGAAKPKLLEILKLLPKTNCRKCGQPTCMVFASLVAQGVKGPEDCPELNGQKSEELKTYMAGFSLED